MPITPENFHSSIKKGGLKAVYLLAGEDEYLLQEALNAIVKAAGPGGLDRDTFSAKQENAASEVILSARTMPFLSASRLITVKEAHKFKAADIEKLTDLISEPLQGTTIVFLWQEKAGKTKASKAFFEAAGKQGLVVEFKPVYENRLPSWISAELKKRGKTITGEALGILIQESGTNLFDLRNEIEKLSLYAAKRDVITADDIEDIGGHTRASNLFKLKDAVQGRKTRTAFAVLESLLRDQEPPLKILSVIYYAFRKMLEARSMSEEGGMSESDIRKQLRLNAFFDRDYFRHLALFGSDELRKGMELILAADSELKSSSKPEKMVLEELILSLLSKGPKAAAG